MLPARLICFFAGLTLFAACAAAPADPQEFRLTNGLRLIVKEDHRAPTTVQQVWYRAGSVDEPVGVTGVAHVLEHMMFKGTRRYGPGEFTRRIAEAGGRDNAFTSKDVTVYHQQVHRDRLQLAMQLEADRMANLLLDPAAFSSEIKVVMEERRWRYEDRPRSLVYENLMAVAFSAHPYHWPVIGWMVDLEAMTWKDARDWYRRWYAPNNATVVIVGDVETNEVLRWARRYYGGIRPKVLPERKPRGEPPQRGLRRVAVKAPAELPYIRMGYKVPALRDPAADTEPYALSVLADILAGHDAARLNQSLVREQRIASSAGASYDLITRGPGMLMLDAAAAQGKTAAELEAALRASLARIVAEGVSAEELTRAKTQRLAQEVYKRDSIFAQAQEIGELESTGLSFRDAERILQKLGAVTAEQVRAVAAKYLVDDNLTAAVLEPQPLEPPSSRPAGAATKR